MRRSLACLVMVLLAAFASPAGAELFSIDVDAQAGYTRLSNINITVGTGMYENATLAGATAGVHGKLKILFLSGVVDYQHFFSNADYLHIGLGADFKLPLTLIEPYVRGSLGLMMLTSTGSAFDPKAVSKLEPEAGFQARAGVGLDIPLGDWFALGAAFDLGYHVITGEHGYDLSVMGYLGLRI